MANNKHLSLSQRVKIEQLLNTQHSFKAISRELDKDCTTISIEGKKHIHFKKSGCFGNAFNNCVNRFTCSLKSLCSDGNCNNKLCKFCSK
jgi:IS30 family transposase